MLLHFLAGASLCILPTIASTALLDRDTSATQCTVSAVSPAPKTILCAAQGKVGTPAALGSVQSVTTKGDCARSCLSNKLCKSFAFTPAKKSSNCRLFSKTVRTQTYTKGVTGEFFYHRNCFSCNKPSTTSTTTATTTSSDPSAATSILPTTVPDTIYTAPVVEDYSQCQFDPSASSFSLLDGDGVPFVNVNGQAAKPTQVLDTMPSYNFVPSSDGTAGLFDLVLDGQYLAVNTLAQVIFVSASTGPRYVTQDGQTYITSIFSYTCDGKLSLGIPNVVPFEFGIQNGSLLGQPILDQFNPGTNLGKLRKRILDDATRLAIAMTRYQQFDRRALIVAPVVTNAAQTADAPRCPNVPTGLVASDQNAKRGPQANGCGSKTTDVLVPDLVFGSCCDNHDLCYDNCGTTFSDCNNNFRSCNHAACEAHYGGGGLFDDIANWGCNNIADFYANVVSGNSGVDAFKEANDDRCTCSCPQYTAECGGTCRSVINDNNNCGACGNTCSTFCNFDHCYSLPPPSNNPCDEQNFEYYSGIDTSSAVSQGVAQEIVRSDISSKRDCCNACYSTTSDSGKGGCLAYYMTQQFTGVNYDQWLFNSGAGHPSYSPATCHIVVQKNEDPGQGLSQPPAECPSGGAPVSFWGQAQGGTARCDYCNGLPSICHDCDFTPAAWGCHSCDNKPWSASIEPCILQRCGNGQSPNFWNGGFTFYDAEPGNCAVH